MESINRNILECKGSKRGYGVCFSSSINRNILECKVKMLLTYTDKVLVLIETYWNVKRAAGQLTEDEDGCINRNILECKGEYSEKA